MGAASGGLAGFLRWAGAPIEAEEIRAVPDPSFDGVVLIVVEESGGVCVRDQVPEHVGLPLVGAPSWTEPVLCGGRSRRR